MSEGSAEILEPQTYPLLIHHYVVAPMLLGQVWSKDIKATAELRKHHVVWVTWRENQSQIYQHLA